MRTSNAPTASYVDATSLTLITSLVVIDSLHLVFARALIPHLHPAVSAMYLMTVGCLTVGAYALVRGHLSFFFMRLLATTAFLVVFVAASSEAQESLSPSAGVWLLLITAGIVDVAISRRLYYMALRRLPMSIHAIILTLSPAATILWTLLLFGSYPQPAQLFGGLLVLAGVLAAMIGPARQNA